MDLEKVQAEIVRLWKQEPGISKVQKHWYQADWFLYTQRLPGPFEVVQVAIVHVKSSYHQLQGLKRLAGPELLETLILHLPLVPLETGCLVSATCNIHSARTTHELPADLFGLDMYEAQYETRGNEEHWTLYQVPPSGTMVEREHRAMAAVGTAVVKKG